MPFTYAIGDLHGRYDLLQAAMIGIAGHAVGRGGTIVTLGDYVDRGPESRQVIELLMSGVTAPNWTLVCLKGNHEDIMWQSCTKLPYMGWWLQNGGGATLMSYGQKEGDTANRSVVPVAHLEWMNNLPLMHVDKHRVYVHAGVVASAPLDEQSNIFDVHWHHKILWKIYDDRDEGGHGYYHVVHGHHQHKDGPILKKGRTNLDTYAWRTGRLVVGIFDDEIPGGPIDFIEVLGRERMTHVSVDVPGGPVDEEKEFVS